MRGGLTSTNKNVSEGLFELKSMMDQLLHQKDGKQTVKAGTNVFLYNDLE